MADQKANIIVGLKDRATKGLGFLKKSVTALGKAAKNAAKVGIALLVAGLGFATKAAIKQEEAIVSLNEALKDTGAFSVEASEEMQAFASELQKASTFGDEAILMAQSLLVRLGKLSGEGLKGATQATADLSAALGLELEEAAKLVGKTLSSSTNALTRYGVEVTGAVGSQERLNSLITNAGKVFGGAALSKTKSLTGQMTQFKNEVGDVAEQIGSVLIPVLREELIPRLREATEFFSKLFGKFSTGTKSVKELKEEYQGLAKRLETINKLAEKTSSFDFTPEISRIKSNMNKILDVLSEREKAEAARNKRLKAVRDIAAQDELDTETKKWNKIRAIREEAFILLEEQEIAHFLRMEENRNKDFLKQKSRLEKLKLLEEQITEEQAEVFREISEEKVAEGEFAAQQLIEIAENGGKGIIQVGKNLAIKEIGIWVEKEIAKALAAAPATLGASLANIPLVAAAGAAGVSAVQGISFRDGGVVNESNSVPVGGADDSQRLVIAEMGETFNGDGNGRATDSSSSPIQVNVMVDKKVLARTIVDITKQQSEGLI